GRGRGRHRVAPGRGVRRAAGEDRRGGIVHGDHLRAARVVPAVVGRRPDTGDRVVLIGAGTVTGLRARLAHGDGRRRIAVVRGRRRGRGRHRVALGRGVRRAAGEDRRGGVVDGDDLRAARVV